MVVVFCTTFLDRTNITIIHVYMILYITMLLFVLNMFIDEIHTCTPKQRPNLEPEKRSFGNRITHTHHEFNSNDSYPRFVSKGTWWSYEAVWWTCLEKSLEFGVPMCSTCLHA